MMMESDDDASIRDVMDFVSRELLGDRADLELDADTDLLGGGLVDSLGVMRLIRHLEETYRVTVPPVDVTIENFMTARAIAGYVESLRSLDASTAGR